MTRVALFTEVFLPKVDGIVNTLCHLLDHLGQRGWSSLLIAPQGAPSQYAGTQVVPIPAARLPFYPELRIANPWINIDSTLDHFRPDLVHVVNPISLGLSGVRYAKSRGLPLVASFHTDLAGFAARWGFGFLSEALWAGMRAIHNQADLNLCPSFATQSELAAHGFSRLKVWSRGVNTRQFHPAKADPEWRMRLSAGQPDRPLLIYAGRLSAEKRVDWIGHVLREYPQARLAVIGDGPQRTLLEMKFEGLPVVFTGYLRGEDLARAYASGDIFVFPAANETFGNVILEAMASGLPVIAPGSGGPLDFVRHGQTGLLFAPEDTRSFVRAAGAMLEDRALRETMGAAGRKASEAREWAGVLEGLVQEYEQLMVAKPGRTQRMRNVFASPAAPKLPEQLLR